MSGDAITRRRGGAESDVAARALLDGRFERISCAQRKPLWSVTIWDKKFNSVATGKQTTAIKYHYLLAGDLKEKIVPGGNVKLLTTSETDWWTTEDKVSGLVSEGEIVSIPWGGNPNVQYFKGRFVTADNRIATSSDKTVLDNKFLYYFMLAKRNTIGSFYRGAGLKHPEMSKVLDMEIPLPNIEAQRAFVRCMDNVSKVIAARKMQLDSLSQLVKSRFVEMFESATSIAWESNPVEEICELIADCPHTTAQDEGVGYPLVRTPNIGKGRLIYDKMHRVSEEVYNLRNKRAVPRERDLILAREAPAGNIAVIQKDEKVCLGQRTVLLRPRLAVIDSEYMAYRILSEKVQRAILDYSSGSTVAHLNVREIRKLKLPIPPLALQREFAAFVEKVDKLAFAVRKSLESAEKLYRQQLSETFA